MCDTCGCGNPNEKAVLRVPGEEPENTDEYIHEHNHEHNHEHEHMHSHSHYHDGTPAGHHHHESDHEHDHHHTSERVISVESDILYANNLMAARNRGVFEARNLKAINLMSSPGSGKTTLLERTVNEMKDKINFSVIEGDQQTMNDAERIKTTGVHVIQVNTGNGCHLDAEMIHSAVKRLAPADNSLIMIENVGNLVCPSLFDLGENKRVVIMSVTEGEDKPLKYPNMFQTTDLCLLNKIDLLPYLDYDISKAIEYGHRINPHLRFISISAKTGEGMEEWYQWLSSIMV
jgi:hydrogenase nickel incorporation protein HypB